MTAPRLSRALAISATVHLAALAGALALAHPGAAPAPPIRVSLVSGGTAAPAPQSAALPDSPAGEHTAPPSMGPASVHRAVSPAPHRTGTRARRARLGGTEAAVAMVTPVQSDLWMLTAPPAAEDAPPAVPSETGGPGGGGMRAAVTGSAEGPGGDGQARATSPGAAGAGPGPDGSSAASLLATLSQRLAWSAERCAPVTAVRTVRHAVPGVPLHFCLDAAGRPSDVSLLGTTGSDQLDRAARDCVVPGALPLPPAPGCYTVEVRFPIRG